MIKKVDQTSVADIFSINSDRVYRIPKYQREYTWRTRDWDALFKDVTENDNGYFLGSYICVNSGSLNGTTCTSLLLMMFKYTFLSEHRQYSS
jgi:hypothetical protein